MNDPIKIRIQRHADFSEIRILLPHPMETGLSKDEQGRSLPPQFIQTLTVELNGKPLIDAQLNASVARNPLFAFRVRELKPGDRLAVAWVDNTGARRRDETVAS
ncbi:MAG: thiosulfate oxidation carrier complex protein SoxZ [Azonexus sp.]|nr:thiosulfate oxidation carrier complex protein SoxZ [Azonexus sp.]MCK6411866.1 thiosulfate oxidation carrier complex protein SoxZ [Azonexus sp.]